MSARERELDDVGERRRLGAWYTPPVVVEGLLALALDPLLARVAPGGPDAVGAIRVLDPACGDGAFLAAVADRIADVLTGQGCSGDESERIAAGCLAGIDVDEGAVDVCRSRLGGGATVLVGDALTRPPGSWEGLAPGGFDLVVGNPPFLGQLRGRTVRDREEAARLVARFGAAVGPYTDPAALFLLLGAQLARPDGGTAAFVLPTSVLAARDGRGARAAVLGLGTVTDLWLGGEGVFDAAVDVGAVVVSRGPAPAALTLHDGRPFRRVGTTTPIAPDEPTWSRPLASLSGIPDRSLATSGTLAEIATATADFRDQYYGLVGHVVDRADDPTGEQPRLVTSGLIDPAWLAWGQRPVSFAKQRYLHPRVDVAGLDASLRAWAARRAVPKVLLATQTRVLEAVVDAEGDLLPSVPVISVVPNDPTDLHRIGALLCAPPATLVAARRHLGAGLGRGALKLRASEVLDLPLPAERAPWDAAATELALAGDAASAGDHEAHRHHLLASARAMVAAYGLGEDEPLVAWWEERLPSRPVRTARP